MQINNIKLTYFCGSGHTDTVHIPAGTPCAVKSLDEINTQDIRNMVNTYKQTGKDDNFIKIHQPAIQPYSCNYRVDDKNLDWDTWTGMVIIDIDSKLHKDFNEKMKDHTYANKTCTDIHNRLSDAYSDNYVAFQLSYSGTSFHYIFYYDVIHTKNMRDICYKHAIYAIKDVFCAAGLSDVINTKGVVDNSCTRSAQIMFISQYPVIFNTMTDGNATGYISNTEVQQLIQDNEQDDEQEIQAITQDDLMDVYIPANKKCNFKKYADMIPDWSYNTARWPILNTLINLLHDTGKVEKYYTQLIDEVLIYHCDPERYDRKTLIAQYKRDMHNHGNKPGNYGMSKNILDYVCKSTGIKLKVKFTPEKYNSIQEKFDKVYNLEPAQYLADVMDDIYNDEHKFIHITAGCGLGKTHAVKNFAKEDLRICLIAPMRSILSNNFADDDRWTVIDKDTCGDLDKRHRAAEINNIMQHSTKSIATTWDNFYRRDMKNSSKYDKPFDLIVFDEVHYMYDADYRVDIITKIKQAIRFLISTKQKTILMTGTPSSEIFEFNHVGYFENIYGKSYRDDMGDMHTPIIGRQLIWHEADNIYRIKVHKDKKNIPCDMLFYTQSYNGYIIKDIKDFMAADEHNRVIVFADKSNMRKMEDLKAKYDMEASMLYNSKNISDTDYINTNNNFKGRFMLASVYAQAGINIIPEHKDNVRIYILNSYADNIIQYANRYRITDNIDKIIVTVKEKSTNNLFKKINYNKISSDLTKESKLCDLNNQINGINNAFFIDGKNKRMFMADTKTAQADYIEIIDDKEIFLEENFITWDMIRLRREYENLAVTIYRRLTDAGYDVNIIQDNDIDDPRTKTQLPRTLQDMMLEFPREAIHTAWDENKNTPYIFINTEHMKIHNYISSCTKQIEYILNILYKKDTDVDKVYDRFIQIMQACKQNMKHITTSNIKYIAQIMHIENHAAQYIDFWICQYIGNTGLTELASMMTAVQFPYDIDWQDNEQKEQLQRTVISIYNDLKEIDTLIKKYSWMSTVFNDGQNMDEDTTYYNDTDKADYKQKRQNVQAKALRLINDYIHADQQQINKKKGTGRAKPIKYNGRIYESMTDAAEKLCISTKKMQRLLKAGKAEMVTT